MYKNVIRQGDVNLAQVAKLPPKAQPIELKKGERIVLAYGEATGHAHAIYDDTDKVKMWAVGKVKYLEVMANAMVTRDIVSIIVGKDGKPIVVGEETIQGVALKHEEHTAHVISPGIYKLPVQVEYSPKEIRRVAD